MIPTHYHQSAIDSEGLNKESKFYHSIALQRAARADKMLIWLGYPPFFVDHLNDPLWKGDAKRYSQSLQGIIRNLLSTDYTDEKTVRSRH